MILSGYGRNVRVRRVIRSVIPRGKNMKRKKRIIGVLTAAALTIAHLPGSEADAASSASDFQMGESAQESINSEEESGAESPESKETAQESINPEEESGAESSESKETAQESVNSEEGNGTESPEAERQVTASGSSSEGVSGNELGNTHVEGNRAVLMIDSSRLRVREGNEEGLSTGSSAVNGEQDGGGTIRKFRIVDGKTVADRAYYRNAGLETLELPEGITEIGEFSFARSALTSAALPEGTEHIGYGAFYHCDNLAEVTLPETVMCVEPKAFDHTLWMKRFLEEDSQGSVRADGQGDFLLSGGVLAAYRGESSEVVIPEGVRVIAAEAFRNHAEIRQVKLPESLQVIGEGAFEGCSSLGHLELGSGVREIKDRAFLGSTLSQMSLPASVEKVGLQAFGTAVVTYEGNEAEQTYESSAARLSNSAYRLIDGGGEETPGVEVEGIAEIFGSGQEESFRTGQTALTGADRAYTLTLRRAEGDRMEAAYRRVFGSSLPDTMLLFELELTDRSGIPLTDLGGETLSVVLPLPEAYMGGEIEFFTLDGNGQLERLEAERVTAEGAEAFRFETNHPSTVGIYSAGG